MKSQRLAWIAGLVFSAMASTLPADQGTAMLEERERAQVATEIGRIREILARSGKTPDTAALARELDQITGRDLVSIRRDLEVIRRKLDRATAPTTFRNIGQGVVPAAPSKPKTGLTSTPLGAKRRL